MIYKWFVTNLRITDMNQEQQLIQANVDCNIVKE